MSRLTNALGCLRELNLAQIELSRFPEPAVADAIEALELELIDIDRCGGYEHAPNLSPPLHHGEYHAGSPNNPVTQLRNMRAKCKA